jgi:hypothetical protein
MPSNLSGSLLETKPSWMSFTITLTKQTWWLTENMLLNRSQRMRMGSSTYSMLLGAQLLSIEGRSSVVFLIFADHSPEPIVPSSVQNSATQVLCHSNSL